MVYFSNRFETLLLFDVRYPFQALCTYVCKKKMRNGQRRGKEGKGEEEVEG
jgi:hypothetical protein